MNCVIIAVKKKFNVPILNSLPESGGRKELFKNGSPGKLKIVTRAFTAKHKKQKNLFDSETSETIYL